MSRSSEPSADRYRAPALDKGLDILELLAASELPLTQAEIAKALARTPNEIYRMLDRLVRRNYVLRMGSDRYELTLRMFALAHQHAPVRRLIAQALPELRHFARTAKQAGHIAVYQQGDVVVLEQVDAPGYWGLAIRVGSHVHLYNTGSGHVLLAFASDQERAFMIDEHELMPSEIRPPDLDQRLEDVRSRGYEMMPSLQSVGVLNLSVPVFGPNGAVVAALTCPYMTRHDEAVPEPLAAVDMLRHAAQRIQPAAGGRPIRSLEERVR